MHRVPVGRRFGGPEVALIAVALAFAVPMTAWWHGLYRQPDSARAQAKYLVSPAQSFYFADAAKVRAIAGFGYVVDVDSTSRTVTLPSFGPSMVQAPFVPAPLNDPNQTLLLIVALTGIVAAGVYSIGVYPALRR